MSNNKKIHYIRGKKEVTETEASAIDFKDDLLSLTDSTDEKESKSDRINRSVSVLGLNEDGDLVATYPDGRQEVMDDD